MGLKNFLLHNKVISPITWSILYSRKAKKDYRQNKLLCDRLLLLKDTHIGEKCFIVGTGPSLTLEDLEVLYKNKVDCFGTHCVFNIFEKTNWRPTYYLAQDYALIDKVQEDIKKTDCKIKLLPVDFKESFSVGQEYFYYTLREFGDYKKKIRFTEKANKYLCQGFTVTYAALQLAVWMGYKEIYLLGIDHNYSAYLDKDGRIVCDERIKDYFVGGMQTGVLPRLDDTNRSYLKASAYTESKGIKIFNATRGGKLEIFTRVNFDELFDDYDKGRNENPKN